MDHRDLGLLAKGTTHHPSTGSRVVCPAFPQGGINRLDFILVLAHRICSGPAQEMGPTLLPREGTIGSWVDLGSLVKPFDAILDPYGLQAHWRRSGHIPGT